MEQTTNNSSKTGTGSGATFATSMPFAIVTAIIAVALFAFQYDIPMFNIIYWVAFPLFIYISGSIFNMVNQYSFCGKTKPGHAFLIGVPILISALVGMGLALIPFLRTIVASAIAPIVINRSGVDITSSKNSNSKPTECCDTGNMRIGLLSLEKSYPLVKGIASAFYIFFGVIFGQVIGSGFSQVC
jgi:hypothetical protein